MLSDPGNSAEACAEIHRLLSSGSLSRLLDHQAPVLDTAWYYVNVCFHFASLLMGFIVFLTIIWFTSRLAQNSEIVAMLAAGMPFKRLFRPYFYASGLLVALALVIFLGCLA